MDNKFINHVSRHGAVYLIAAILVIGGGISMRQSVPNFHSIDNQKALTGNVGEILNGNNKLQLLQNSAQSAVLKTGETLNMNWSGGQKVKFYLVPNDVTKKAIPIRGTISKNGLNQSFAWQIPASIETGTYNVGMQSGGSLSRTNETLVIIQAASEAQYAQALNQMIASTKSQVESKELKLGTFNTQLTEKQNNLVELKNSVATMNQKLQSALTLGQSQSLKSGASNSQISALKIQIATSTSARTNLEGQIYKLKKVISTLEADIVQSKNLLFNLEAKLNEVNLNAKFNPNNLEGLKANFNPQSKEGATGVLKTDGTNQTAALQTQIEEKKGQMAQLVTQVNQKSASLNTLYNQIQTTEAGVSALKADVASTSLALQNAKNAVSLKETELKQAMSGVEMLEMEMKSGSASTDLESKLKEASIEMEKAEMALKLAQDNAAVSENKMLEVQASLQKAQEQLTALQTQVQTVEADVNQTNLKINDVKNQIATLEQSLTIETTQQSNSNSPTYLSQ